MRVSEERLTTVLARADHSQGLSETNPVASLIVESIAASHPDHSDAIRDTGRFFLDLVEANEEHATRLTLPVAMHVLARDERLSARAMGEYLAEVAAGDLLLGISIHALLPPTEYRTRSRRAQRERAAVTRILYLLVRMFEAQEESDSLDRAFAR